MVKTRAEPYKEARGRYDSVSFVSKPTLRSVSIAPGNPFETGFMPQAASRCKFRVYGLAASARRAR
jgi:hypothetical protein